MATMYCARCSSTAVRKRGEVCSRCRYAISHPETIPASERPPAAPPASDPANVDLADLLRRGIAQVQDQQQRLQDALDGNGLFQGDTLNEMTKLVRVLETLVELELKLRKAARGKVKTNDERIDAMVAWAREDLPKAKLERLQTLIAEISYGRAA